jgi:hypothetical protein
MARPTKFKLYDANELSTIIGAAMNLLRDAKSIINKGEAKAFDMAKKGLPAHDCNTVGRVAFRDAGQLVLQAMQLIADTQGKNLSSLSGDELDDMADFGFRWGNFAQLGCPADFTHFSIGNVDASLLGAPADGAANLTMTAISKTDRDLGGVGSTPPNPWGYIADSAYPATNPHTNAAIKFVRFPDLEGSYADWSDALTRLAFSYDVAGERYFVEEGSVFAAASTPKFSWTGDAGSDKAVTADSPDVLSSNLVNAQRSGEQALRFAFTIASVQSVDNSNDTFLPVSSEFFMIREIASTIDAINGSS